MSSTLTKISHGSKLGRMTEPMRKEAGGAVPVFTVHDRCRKAREWAELEQDELAERVGISRQTVGNYERADVHTLKVLVLRAWADACGVDPEWLIGGTEDPIDPDSPSPDGSGNAHNPRYGNFRLVTTPVSQMHLFDGPSVAPLLEIVKRPVGE